MNEANWISGPGGGFANGGNLPGTTAGGSGLTRGHEALPTEWAVQEFDGRYWRDVLQGLDAAAAREVYDQIPANRLSINRRIRLVQVTVHEEELR